MRQLFAPGRIWYGRTVFVFASGPSLDLRTIRAAAIARQAGKAQIIAVSDAIYPCWFADILYSADAEWWVANPGAFSAPGHKVSLDKTGDPRTLSLINTGFSGYDTYAGNVRTGGNSGYQAVHLAAQIGARKIIISGLDFSADGARNHYFGKHRGGMDKHSDTDGWLTAFKGLTEVLQAENVLVMNASPRSRIDWLQPADTSALE